LQAPVLLVSFNDEGFINRSAMEAMLAHKPHVRVLEIPYNRYVGAKIGIHNPKGEKVGTVGRLTNLEYLFLASDLPLPELLAQPLAKPLAMPQALASEPAPA
jgi:adenine-specific DNA-methyltransferase